MNAAQNFEVPKAVGGEVPSIYQALDVTLSFAASLTQVTIRGAEVDVINNQLPPLTLANTNRVTGEVGGGKKSFVVTRSSGIAQVKRSLN